MSRCVRLKPAACGQSRSTRGLLLGSQSRRAPRRRRVPGLPLVLDVAVGQTQDPGHLLQRNLFESSKHLRIDTQWGTATPSGRMSGLHARRKSHSRPDPSGARLWPEVVADRPSSTLELPVPVLYNGRMPDNALAADDAFVSDWPTCEEDVVPGCRGIRAGVLDRCLAHLGAVNLDQFFSDLRPGEDFDARGTTFTGDLFARLRQAYGANRTQSPVGPNFGQLRLDGARFHGDVDFSEARFGRDTVFDNVTFHGHAKFDNAHFHGDATFDNATFREDVTFVHTQFHNSTMFTGEVVFAKAASFKDAQFDRDITFDRAKFMGTTTFELARFANNAWFGRDAHFYGAVSFKEAEFGFGHFDGTHFDKAAVFGGARFSRVASFGNAEFHGTAEFRRTHFRDDAWFKDVKFGVRAGFAEAEFDADAHFAGATFAGDAVFRSAKFKGATTLGPLIAARVQLDDALFSNSVAVELDTDEVSCDSARFEAGIALRVRSPATVSLKQVNFGGPSSLEGQRKPFLIATGENGIFLSRDPFQYGTAATLIEEWAPQLMSLQGTDVTELVITDVSLRRCLFAGAHHLDKLRIEGSSPFHRPPAGWHCGSAWPFAWRWTRRQVLAEEHAWRLGRPGGKAAGWEPHPLIEQPADMGPQRLAGLYRSLRKASEDGKDEAGAGDFYYGEMEARRHAGSTRDKIVLGAYWLVSGYGQRAVRALVGLAALVTVLTVLLLGWGLPADSPPQLATGRLSATQAGAPQAVTLQMSDIPIALPPSAQRWTAARAEKAFQLALGSVVFRDAAQKLTTTGTWTTMVGRFLGPVLLALAVLAIRARVKR